MIVGLPVSSARADDSHAKQVACSEHFQRAYMKLQKDASSVAETDQLIAAAQKEITAGEACLPRSPKARPASEQARTKLAAIQARRKILAEVDVLHGEVAAMAKRFATIDDAGFKALVDEAATLEKKLQAYVAANKVDRDTFAADIGNLKSTAGARGNVLRDQKIAAGRALITDAAVTKLGFAPEDSLDQAKIRDAFAKVAATDIVSIVPAGEKGAWRTDIRFVPVTVVHADLTTFASGGKPNRFGAEISRDNGELKMYFDSGGKPKAPADHAPALVWNKLDNHQVVIVTMDGGRYIAHVDALAKGLGKPEHWPTAVQSVALPPADIAALADAKLLPAALKTTLASSNEANEKCRKAVWAPAQREFDAIDAQNIAHATKKARWAQVQSRYEGAAAATCGGHEANFRKAWSTAIETRQKERAQTLAAAKARFTALASELAQKP